jgi:hypothetical protein
MVGKPACTLRQYKQAATAVACGLWLQEEMGSISWRLATRLRSTLAFLPRRYRAPGFKPEVTLNRQVSRDDGTSGCIRVLFLTPRRRVRACPAVRLARPYTILRAWTGLEDYLQRPNQSNSYLLGQITEAAGAYANLLLDGEGAVP